MSWLDDLHKVVLDNQQGFGAAAGALSAGRGIGGAGAAFAQGRGLDLQRAQKTKQQEMQESLLARQKEMRESMTGANAPQWMQNLDEATRGYVGSNPQLFDNVMRDQVMRSMNPAEPAKRQTMKGADGFQYYTDDQSRVLPDVQMTPKTTNRKTLTDPNGVVRYVDNKEPVFPDVTKNVKLTDIQGKASGFADRISEALPMIEKFGDESDSGWNNVAKHTPIFGNSMVSDEYQQLDQASRNFINAVLRRESGAAISDSEFSNAYKQYIPQYGDSAAVLKQKKINRQTVLDNMQRDAGATYKPKGQGKTGSGGASGDWNNVSIGGVSGRIRIQR